MNIRPMGAELFHADRRTDRHDDANNGFSARQKPYWQGAWHWYGNV